MTPRILALLALAACTPTPSPTITLDPVVDEVPDPNVERTVPMTSLRVIYRGCMVACDGAPYALDPNVTMGDCYGPRRAGQCERIPVWGDPE